MQVMELAAEYGKGMRPTKIRISQISPAGVIPDALTCNSIYTQSMYENHVKVEFFL
jgi:hypothetical protein